MFTPAIAASSGSAPCVIIWYAFATPRSPFAEAMATGRPAGAAGAGHSTAPRTAGVAASARETTRPAAAVAPAPRKSRRESGTGPPGREDGERVWVPRDTLRGAGGAKGEQPSSLVPSSSASLLHYDGSPRLLPRPRSAGRPPTLAILRRAGRRRPGAPRRSRACRHPRRRRI